jgi:hypothetical protein
LLPPTSDEATHSVGAPVVPHASELGLLAKLLKRHAHDVGVYLAVGDSMSIDHYTGVDGGGAASQLAGKLGFELVDFTG